MAPTRRDVLKQLGVASAGLALSGRILDGQTTGITVAGQAVEVTVSSVNAYTVRMTVRAITGGSDAILNDGALVRAEWGVPVARWRGRERAEIKAGDVHARIVPGDTGFSFSVEQPPQRMNVVAGGRTVDTNVQARSILQALTVDGATGTVSLLGNIDGSASETFFTPAGPTLGFGEGGRQFDRRGGLDRMRSGQVTDQQSGYALRTNGGRVPIQWLIHSSTGAVYIHQPLGTFDLTGAFGKFTPPAATPLPLDIFIVGSRDPLAIMKAYADITGLPEMPPLWSFGYLQSHRTLGGPKEVLWVADTMREKKLPCDALIYLGTEFTPSGWNTRNGEFAWNASNFPTPKTQIDELHARHFKVVLHTVIEGQRLTGVVTDACAAPEPSGRTADNRWPAERSAGCYWPHHKEVYDIGVDGWWPDQGDGYDPASKLRRIKMYWEGSQQFRPNERPFALHRNGYAGMQRYGAFLWSGDVYTLWETLKNHIPIAINCGLSGMPYWGTDIGGFVPTAEYTGELHVRWFQFGAFCTLFRAHGRDWHLRLPWGWNTGDVGPVEVQGYTGGAQNPDPSELHNADVEPICRKYLDLRYRLMPYLYSAVREGTGNGLPVIRAMWLHHADDPVAVARGDQYLWGRDLLVAPVVEKGAATRRLYLPKGVWHDFWTEARVDGGKEIDRAVDLATMPIYARAGAIIPMGPVKQYTGEAVSGPLSITVYPGADGTFSLFEDDGKSFDYRRGAWLGISMRWRDAERRLTLELTPGSRMLAPNRRPVEVRLAGTATTKTVTFEGRTLEVRL